MKPHTESIEWTGANIPNQITILQTEDHWESVVAHFRNERDHDCKRVSEETEKNIRRKLTEEHREKALQVQSLISAFEEAIPSAFQEMEQALTHMACTLTRKLIADVPVDAERMHAVISQALNELENESEISIMIHPDDLALLKEESGENFAATFSKEGKLDFKTDPHLTRGGCYITTPFGDFDATVETKWERIESLFQKQMESHGLFKRNQSERKVS